MVVKLVRWPSWSPFSSKKYEAIIKIQRLEGLGNLSMKDVSGLVVELKWKGQKITGLSSWRRSVKRNYTEKGNVREGGESVDWNEEFRSLCSFLSSKEDLITPWKVSFTVLQKGENQMPRNCCTVVGAASLNLAEYASSANGKEIQISLPLKARNSTAECSLSLLLSLRLLELRTDAKHLRMVQRSIMPVTLSPPSSLALSTEKDGLAAIKAGLDRVNIFSYCVSAGKTKEVVHEQEAPVNRLYIKDKDSHSSSLDSHSLDDSGREDSSVSPALGYEKLYHVNRVAGSSLPDSVIGNATDECWIYCGNDAGGLDNDGSQIMQQTSMRKILSWKKRKLSFKSPKTKGEPLLKKHYGEEGGDDIDFDRRQLSTNELFSSWYNLELSAAAFGDDNFAVGTWEQKEITSRDGHLKLRTEVFFASIDQRSERAAGESACTALVAVIADWLLTNQDEMPIKSELDNLIKDGSAEWRNLCENKDYMEQFSDKHFDLDTVIEAKIRPLSVVPEKSYVGFFHPEGLEEGVFEFLQGAMSFDNIWNEISLLASDNPTNGSDSSSVYIVSWNDHFFILKVERDAYYIIDTLGERLYEGCNQAYILKFDKETKICRVSNNTKASEEKSSDSDETQSNNTKASEEKSSDSDTKASEEKSSDSDMKASEEKSSDSDETQSKNTKASEEKSSDNGKTQSENSKAAEEKSSDNDKMQSKNTNASEEKPSDNDEMQAKNTKASEEKPSDNDEMQAKNTNALEENPSSHATQPNHSEDALTAKPKETLSTGAEEALTVKTKEASSTKEEDALTTEPKEWSLVESKEASTTESKEGSCKEGVVEKNVEDIEDEPRNDDIEEEEIVCTGKECCQEYIKSFLAAIPLRELQEDAKKGLNSLGSLHQRLQIEFHHTKLILDQILAKATTDDCIS